MLVFYFLIVMPFRKITQYILLLKSVWRRTMGDEKKNRSIELHTSFATMTVVDE